MCVDAIESKYQILNKCKLLVDISNNICIVYGNIPVRLAKLERNFTNLNFYLVTKLMSKHNFYFEMDGIVCLINFKF